MLTFTGNVHQGQTAQLKQQIPELAFLVVLHVDIYRQCAPQPAKIPVLIFAVLDVQFCG